MDSRCKRLLRLAVGDSSTSKENENNKSMVELFNFEKDSNCPAQQMQEIAIGDRKTDKEYDNNDSKVELFNLFKSSKHDAEQTQQIVEDVSFIVNSNEGILVKELSNFDESPNCPAEQMQEIAIGDKKTLKEYNNKDSKMESFILIKSSKPDAEKTQQMIVDVSFNGNSNEGILDSMQTSPLPPINRPLRHTRKINKPTRPIPESESELELFGGDFSDGDETYKPDGLVCDTTQSTDNENNLLTLEDLLGPHIDEPSSSHQGIEPNIDNAFDVASIILTDILDQVWKRVKPLARWRTARPNTWKRNVAKKRRAEGLAYETNKKMRAAKVPKAIDCSNCKFKCTNTFADEDREKICRVYWNQNFVGKKNFILSHITAEPPKRVQVNRKRSQRQYTTKCYFDKDSKKQVCQKYFCSTLSISPSVISDAVQNQDALGLYLKNEEPRGRHEPSNKISAERVQEVVDQINSFPVMEGHYIRKQSKRKYLDSTLSITKLYELYCEKYKDNPVIEITYRRIFAKEFNLSFFVPKKDQCLICNKYNSAQGQEKTEMDNSYQNHMKRKEKSEQEKEKDKNRAEKEKNFISVTFDLQAILQIPCSQIGILYYVRKLTIYNLCIYESALPNNAYCFPWTEVHGKKGSAEIGTILLHYLTKCIPSNVTEVSLFSDTCSGQNRNQYVAAILLWIVNNIDNLQVIEQKFLESGHSHMEADSMHSSIETAKKHVDVFSVNDWINIFKKARSKEFYKVGKKKVKKAPYHVKQFKYNEFLDLKNLAENTIKNRTKDNEGNKVNWLKIKRLKFVKGKTKILFNYDMSEDFLHIETMPQILPQSAPRTRKTHRNQKENPSSESPARSDEGFTCPPLKQLYNKPLPISAAKKKDLLSLCEKGVIPEEYHGWFQSLCCENTADRLPDVAAAETSSEKE